MEKLSFKERVYQSLFRKGHINCSYDDFECSSIEFHQNSSELFQSIYFDLDWYEADSLLSTLRAVTEEDLKGYLNVEDYIVQQHELARYIKDGDFEYYLLLSDDIEFDDLDLFVS